MKKKSWRKKRKERLKKKIKSISKRKKALKEAEKKREKALKIREGRKLENVLARMRTVYPENQIEKADDILRIDGQILFHPHKLYEMMESPSDLMEKLMKVSRKLREVEGDTARLSDEANILYKELTTSRFGHRFRFRYQLVEEVNRFLEPMGVLDHRFFQSMTHGERGRIYNLIGQYKDTQDINRIAARYSLNKKPKSVFEFVEQFEFFHEYIKRESLKRFNKFKVELNIARNKPINATIDQRSYTNYTERVFGERLDSKKKVRKYLIERLMRSERIGPDLDKFYRKTAKALQGHHGVKKVSFHLSKDRLVAKIKKIRLHFSTELAAAYHARKHIDELPGFQRIGGNEVGQYLKSLRKTLAEPTHVDDMIDQYGSRRLIFVKEYSTSDGPIKMRAIVSVRRNGDISVATYGGE